MCATAAAFCMSSTISPMRWINRAHWDITARLGEIRAPTLVIGGRFDEATPLITETVHRGIAGSELIVIPGAGHLTNLEQPELFNGALARFLSHRV